MNEFVVKLFVSAIFLEMFLKLLGYVYNTISTEMS